jgi:hypothetical protein
MRIKLDVHLRLNLLRMRNNDRVTQIYWTLSVFFIGTLFFCIYIRYIVTKEHFPEHLSSLHILAGFVLFDLLYSV